MHASMYACTYTCVYIYVCVCVKRHIYAWNLNVLIDLQAAKNALADIQDKHKDILRLEQVTRLSEHLVHARIPISHVCAIMQFFACMIMPLFLC
jgi:hypothetical protein